VCLLVCVFVWLGGWFACLSSALVLVPFGLFNRLLFELHWFLCPPPPLPLDGTSSSVQPFPFQVASALCLCVFVCVLACLFVSVVGCLVCMFVKCPCACALWFVHSLVVWIAMVLAPPP
jgi:hypothetical protein